MADIFFLLAGIVLFFKKEVHISRKRTLAGRPVKILAILYILPFTVGFLGSIFVSAIGADLSSVFWVSIPLVAIAILTTLYFIFFYKESRIVLP
jgi:membrane protein YdbS with pleckstrin-like domain